MSRRDHFEEGMLWSAPTCEGQFPNGCGASTVDHNQSLSAPMVKGLVKIWRGTGRRHGVVFHPDKGGFGLSHIELSNFQKMRYFDLVRMAFDEIGKRIDGYWVITRKGALFAAGIGYCRQRVWTWRGKPLEYDGEVVDIFTYDPTVWEAADYAQRARPHEEDPDA